MQRKTSSAQMTFGDLFRAELEELRVEQRYNYSGTLLPEYCRQIHVELEQLAKVFLTGKN